MECGSSVIELIRKLVLSSCLMLMSRENPWQVASAAIISMASHLLYTHCRPMLQPEAQVLQHVALGVMTLNCKPLLSIIVIWHLLVHFLVQTCSDLCSRFRPLKTAVRWAR